MMFVSIDLIGSLALIMKTKFHCDSCIDLIKERYWKKEEIKNLVNVFPFQKCCHLYYEECNHNFVYFTLILPD